MPRSTWLTLRIAGPIFNYIQNPLPPGSDGGQLVGDATKPGVLGKGQAIAFALTTFNSFWAYVMPIFGAVVADTWLGRYKAICVFTVVKILAQVVLTATASPAGIRSGAAYPGLIVGFVLLGIGTGGIKSNVSPLIADQVTERKAYTKELPSGERVIVDPNATMQRLFSMFYCAINIGACLKIATVYLEKDIGFWASFLLPTALSLLMPAILLFGHRRYVKIAPRGSVLLEAIRVLRIVVAKAASWNPITFARNLSADYQISPTERAGIFHFAKPSTIMEEARVANGGVDVGRPSWLTWDATFADELARTLRACAIFIFLPIYWLPYLLMTNNLVSQAGVLSLGGVPNDILSAFNPIAVVILLPIMDRFVYPTLRKSKIPFPPVNRIFVGFILASSAMAYAAILQSKIYSQSPCLAAAGYDCDHVSISLWVQLPVYIMVAASEIFASVTGLEIGYTKAPARLKSVVTSLFLLTNAFASAISFGLTPVSEDPHLVWLYTGISVAAALGGVAFYFTFRKWNVYEDTENEIGRGKDRVAE